MGRPNEPNRPTTCGGQLASPGGKLPPLENRLGASQAVTDAIAATMSLAHDCGKAQAAGEPFDEALALFLVESGALRQEVVERALQERTGQWVRLGQLAAAYGMLDEQQMAKVRATAEESGEPFGCCALRLGMLTRTELAWLVKEHCYLRPSLSEVLLSQGAISREQKREFDAWFQAETPYWYQV